MYKKLSVALFAALIVISTLASGALAAQPANAVGVMVSEFASGRSHPHGITAEDTVTTFGYSIGRPSILVSRN